jgi:hypothetical protein
MKARLLKNRIAIYTPLIALMAGPVYSATVSVQSCITTTAGVCAGTGGTLAEPDQTLTYSGANQNVTVSGPTPFMVAAFISDITKTGGPTTAFTLWLTEPNSASPLGFAGSFNVTTDTITFTGTGSTTVNGTTFATISDGGTLFGIQNLVPPNLGKGISIAGLIVPGTAVPEPGMSGLAGLGILVLTVALKRRRLTA